MAWNWENWENKIDINGRELIQWHFEQTYSAPILGSPFKCVENSELKIQISANLSKIIIFDEFVTAEKKLIFFSFWTVCKKVIFNITHF